MTGILHSGVWSAMHGGLGYGKGVGLPWRVITATLEYFDPGFSMVVCSGESSKGEIEKDKHTIQRKRSVIWISRLVSCSMGRDKLKHQLWACGQNYMSHPINKTSDLKCKRKEEGRKQKEGFGGGRGGGSKLEGQEKERKTKQQMITHRGGIWGGGGWGGGGGWISIRQTRV